MTTMNNLYFAMAFGAIMVAGKAALGAAPDETHTAAGWLKSRDNPVLGGDLGTCFDVSLLKEADTLRMWFSWRPKKSVALVESKDGIHWSKPRIVLGPSDKTDWESEINRPTRSFVPVRDNGIKMRFTNRTRSGTKAGGCCGTTADVAVSSRSAWLSTRGKTWGFERKLPVPTRQQVR